jgi:hypothetical protein
VTEDEAAAVAIALSSLLKPQEESAAPVSRWKVANRKPDLEIEELRVH